MQRLGKYAGIRKLLAIVAYHGNIWQWHVGHSVLHPRQLAKKRKEVPRLDQEDRMYQTININKIC
jgi:hypothetical protein